jgi:hypothetical protein
VEGPDCGTWRTDAVRGFASFLDVHADLFPDFGDAHDGGHWDGYVRPAFPEPGGLLVWGWTDNGDTLLWDTQDDDPDRWRVVMLPRHEPAAIFFDGGVVAFLVALLRGEHPKSAYLVSTQARWTMHSDWMNHDLNITAGPAISSE